jgi:hypothetical protein
VFQYMCLSLNVSFETPDINQVAWRHPIFHKHALAFAQLPYVNEEADYGLLTPWINACNLEIKRGLAKFSSCFHNESAGTGPDGQHSSLSMMRSANGIELESSQNPQAAT